eukprot:674719-Hanusia_phi.AAC.2
MILSQEGDEGKYLEFTEKERPAGHRGGSGPETRGPVCRPPGHSPGLIYSQYNFLTHEHSSFKSTGRPRQQCFQVWITTC